MKQIQYNLKDLNKDELITLVNKLLLENVELLQSKADLRRRYIFVVPPVNGDIHA